MGTITEAATWPSTVYLMETTDYNLAGEDGVLNVQAKALANRTKWIKDSITAAGIPAIGTTPVYQGLTTLISDVTFSVNVTQNSAVYLTDAGIFDLAIADGSAADNYVGIADVTGSKVILLGLRDLTVAGATPNVNIYLSSSVAGGLTISETDVCIGRHLVNNVVCLTNAFGFYRGEFPASAEAQLRRTAIIYG